MRVEEGTRNANVETSRVSATDTHRVERGDTLSDLAARYGTTVGAFMRANPQIRDADRIFTGDTLNIPGRSALSADGGGAQRLTVQRGDTLSELAAQHGTTVQAFMRANPQVRDADRIQAGARLNVPGGGSGTAGDTTAAGGSTAGADAASSGNSNGAAPGADAGGGSLDINRIQNVKGNPNVTPAFVDKVDAMAQRLGTKPEYLMAVMSFESGLRPDAVNSQSGATGLIQFIPGTANALGTSTSQLRGMSAEQQLKYVEAYFQPFEGKLDTLEGVYTAVLSGKARPDPNTTLFSSGTLAYSQNRGLDFDRDGRITSGEATSAVASRLFGGVEAVQKRLVEVGAASGEKFVDGAFGSRTSDALRRFQSSNGLAPTGLLDERTGRALFGSGGAAPQPPGGASGASGNNAWPVPGHTSINRADKAGEGEGAFGTSRGGGARTHKGIDINAPVGSSVVALRAGTVTGVNQDPGGYGLWISVRHANGLETRYAHLSDADVKVGDKVGAGQEIGNVGRSGNTPPAGDAHLHFETRVNGTAVDPRRYL